MPVLADIHFQIYEGSKESQGKAVLLIHGAGGNYLSWPAQLRRLHGFRVFAIDLPGHGKSGGVGRQSIQDYAEIILAWMTEVGLNQVFLIGHSMGAAISLHLVLEHPELSPGLVLIGAGAQLKVNPALLDDFSSQTSYLNGIQKTVSWSFCEHTPRRLVELVEKRMAETRQGVLYGDFLACNSFDESTRLHEIQQPVLLLCGKLDKMTPGRSAQFLADRIEHSLLKIIPDAGHMVMLEKPESVAEEVNVFLSGFQ